VLKEANPDWGCERIAALLLRGPTLPASPEPEQGQQQQRRLADVPEPLPQGGN
jgi:hypothetical protein